MFGSGVGEEEEECAAAVQGRSSSRGSTHEGSVSQLLSQVQQQSPERDNTLEEEEEEEGNSYQEAAKTDDSRYVSVVFPYQNKASFCKILRSARYKLFPAIVVGRSSSTSTGVPETGIHIYIYLSAVMLITWFPLAILHVSNP